MTPWEILTFVFGIYLSFFAVVKGFVDFNTAIKTKSETKSDKKNDKLLIISPKLFVAISVLFLLSSYFVIYTILLLYNWQHLRGKSQNSDGSKETVVGNSPTSVRQEARQSDHQNEKVPLQTPCRLTPGSATFHTDTETCIGTSGCDAAVRLCLGVAQSLGRSAVANLGCPSRLGDAVSLRERQAVSAQLRKSRCYPQSYAWLAGMTGEAADDTRGAWRALVCPEHPTVFENSQFDPFRPLPFDGCPK